MWFLCTEPDVLRTFLDREMLPCILGLHDSVAELHEGWVQAMMCTTCLCTSLVAATPVMRSTWLEKRLFTRTPPISTITMHRGMLRTGRNSFKNLLVITSAENLNDTQGIGFSQAQEKKSIWYMLRHMMRVESLIHTGWLRKGVSSQRWASNLFTDEFFCRLELNEFGDWAYEEFLDFMLPNRGQPRPPLWAEGQTPNIHVPTLNHSLLPSTLDWRGTPADSPVKDQAMCGSCWVSFSAIVGLGVSRMAYLVF